MDICFATNNLHKLEEIMALLGPEFNLLSLEDIGCNEELKEEGSTLEENSRQKASYVYYNYGIACFADDTGLEVEALGGDPGVYSARYAGEQKSNEDNIRLLLDKLSGLGNRKAQFRTIITLIIDGDINLFEGVVKGVIIDEKRGKAGFGYDSVFIPENHDRTFAEMTMEDKSNISHRGKAVLKLVQYLKSIT
jgi:XTP/dITP diphosphohydrolase